MSRFVAYALRVHRRLATSRRLRRGIRERSTSFDASTLPFHAASSPADREQTAIADYLDRETAQIDALIEKQKRLIWSLGEWRAQTVRGTLMEIDPRA